MTANNIKVFISWSGDRSRAMAEALRQWLPQVIQAIDPWMSAADIEAGERWVQAIAGQLKESSFGIFCLTPENLQSAWMNFEAGAISKTVEKTFVVPYLLNLTPTQVTGPLSQFQAKPANMTSTLEVLTAINRASDNGLRDEALKSAFEKWWPDLEKRIAEISAAAVPAEPRRRPIEEMVEEVLTLVRNLSRWRADEVRRVEPEISTASPEYRSIVLDAVTTFVPEGIDVSVGVELRRAGYSSLQQIAQLGMQELRRRIPTITAAQLSTIRKAMKTKGFVFSDSSQVTIRELLEENPQ